jgi:subtilisin family serine protease
MSPGKLLFSGQMPVGPLIALLTLAAQSGLTQTAVPDQILVKPIAHLSEQAVQSVFAAHGASQVDSIPQIDVRVLQVPETNRDRVLAALKHNPNIEFAELNALAAPTATTNDPYVVNNYEWHLLKLQAFQAWDISVGTNAVVAICDSGVDPTQPDLVGKLLPGYNFYANNTDTSDQFGHGTGVAGAAAAQGNNGIGVAGVAWNALILPLKISAPDGSATYSAIANAFTYAVDHGARVINISYGGSSSTSTLDSAVNYVWTHNGVIFASAGNAGTSAPQYPAACKNVVAVSATGYDDDFQTWSSYGSDVSLSAPGIGIWTTKNDGTYNAVSGTSFSSPVAAGCAALLLAYNPQLTNSGIVNLLESNADDLGAAGYDIYFGYGRVNAYRALLAAAAPSVDTTPPVTSIASPASASIVSGIVNVQANASDDVGVTKIELYVDNVLANISSQVPLFYAWDTTGLANGLHTLHSLAYDSAGNTGASSDVSVDVENNPAVSTDTTPPIAQITSPMTGSIVKRSQKICTTTSDNVGVVRVELYVDNALAASSTTSSPTFTLNTTKWSKGTHTLEALAYDVAGNAGASPLDNVIK